MAMVDSSVGGKTGVNHPLGKNMIGAFYQPKVVLVDVDTLNSLPDRELASGISEIIKYGLIRDPALFEWLEANMERLLARDAEVCFFCRFTSGKHSLRCFEGTEQPVPCIRQHSMAICCMCRLSEGTCS